jgi:hypothetical protein
VLEEGSQVCLDVATANAGGQHGGSVSGRAIRNR